MTGRRQTPGVTITAADIRWVPAPVAVREPSRHEDFVVDVILEARIYRELAQQAIHRLHDEHVKHERLRLAHERVLDEYRALRQHMARRDAGAAA